MNKLKGIYNYLITRFGILAHDKPTLLDVDYFKEFGDYIDKYRWHDLRKNPNDLPGLGTRVEVVMADKETGEIEDNYFTRYGISSPFNSYKLIDAWIAPYDCCFYSSEIIAWREIEPFKEG